MARLVKYNRSKTQSDILRIYREPGWINAKRSTGTTIMAVEYDGGVVIGADSRSTVDYYVCSRICNKLTKVSDTIYCCHSGSAADTEAIADIVTHRLNFYSIEMDRPPLVATAAEIFREQCYNNRNWLSASVIVAGWDSSLGGQLYSIPAGGMCLRQKVSIGGSGSTYIFGYVDANFKENMTKEEAMDFVTNGLSLAMERDGSSGGVVRLGVINKGGIDRSTVFPDQLPYPKNR